MKKQTAMIGVSKKGRSGFDIITHDQPIKPGTYSKFTFASTYPKQYEEFIKAGMPALGDGKPVLITIK